MEITGNCSQCGEAVVVGPSELDASPGVSHHVTMTDISARTRLVQPLNKAVDELLQATAEMAAFDATDPEGGLARAIRVLLNQYIDTGKLSDALTRAVANED